MIYQNSEISQQLDPTLQNEFGNRITLINNHIDKDTNQRFTSLGAIYNNALIHIPEDADIITFWDDDDIFLTNHLSAGVEGLNKVKQLNEVAKNRNQSLAQMALAWILKDIRITSVILGASKVQQVKDGIEAIKNIDFTKEELDKIEFILRQ